MHFRISCSITKKWSLYVMYMLTLYFLLFPAQVLLGLDLLNPFLDISGWHWKFYHKIFDLLFVDRFCTLINSWVSGSLKAGLMKRNKISQEDNVQKCKREAIYIFFIRTWFKDWKHGSVFKELFYKSCN